jgi:succinate-semialdehyde dehydrogenase/glutarate-semialdehyde dehydrogenase
VLIDGTWEIPDATFDVTNPADGSLAATIGWGTPADARRAADAAARAFPAWAGSPARHRADLLLEAARLISDRADAIGRLLTQEAGKRLPEAVAEVGFSAEYFRWFAEQARRPQGEMLIPEAPGRRHLTLRRPAGVVANLTPWNDPLPSVALAPMGGVTQSGLGREGAALGLEEFQDVRCVAWRG